MMLRSFTSFACLGLFVLACSDPAGNGPSATSGASPSLGGSASLSTSTTSSAGGATSVGGASSVSSTTGTTGTTSVGGTTGVSGSTTSGGGTTGVTETTGAGGTQGACAAGLSDCAGVCSDLNTDATNCGSCGTVCVVGSSCAGGICSCVAGRTSCAGACVDTASDASNCGGCGMVCGAGQVCSGGVCASSCAGGETQCGNSCVDLATSLDHCGACATACGAGQSCAAGACSCPAGQTLCGDQCTDPQSDSANCGGCGSACGGGQSCSAGACSCPSGQTLCSDTCTDTSTDEANCGSCGTACASGETCTGGSCMQGSTGGGGAVYMPAFIIGADISGVQQAEDRGTRYKDTDGSTPSGTLATGGGILTILKNHGFNYIRLRTWVNPSGGYCDLAHTKTVAAGVKMAGMGLLLDFHYSDTWADPGTQTKPAAWANLSFDALTTQVYDYTKDVITQLVAVNGRPDMVQVGNEIPQGLLFDSSGGVGGNGGKVSGSAFGNLAALLNAGVQGVKDVDSNIKIMMHLDRCNDLAVNDWWVSGVQGAGVPFDILGESCYDRSNYQQPASDWAPTFASLASSYPNLKFLAAEYSDSKQLVNDTLYNIPDKRGLGTFIWEPTSWGETIFDGSGRAQANYMSIYENIAATYGNR